MHHSGFADILWFLLASVITVPIFRRFGLSAVLGYLFVGIILGPFGLKVINDPESTLAISELGVVMMLFIIGLELTPTRLWQLRRRIFIAGGLQVTLSSIFLYLVFSALGLSWQSSLILSVGLALSSTAVVLQLLAERKQLASAHGKSAFGILLFQDIVAIPLLAAIPLLGHSVSVGNAFSDGMIIKALLVLFTIIFLGRYVMSQLFRAVAWTQMREIFTATALLLVIGTGWLLQSVGLSMGLGAFLAGVLMADSEFRHEIAAQVEPFKGLLLGLFFISVGMTISFDSVMQNPVFIMLGVMCLMGIKALVLYALGAWQCRVGNRESLLLAGTMAMGGEFAFVVFADSVKFGLIEAIWRDRLVAIVGISIALTPLILIALQKYFGKKPIKVEEPVFDPIDEQHPRVVIAGFGRVGQIVGRMLRARKISFIALENSVEQVTLSRKYGNLIFFGDPSRLEVLQSAHIAHAELLIIAADNPETNMKIARLAKKHYPNLRIIARARNRQHSFKLMDLGVPTVREALYSSIEIGKMAFMSLGIKQSQADEYARRFMEHDERILAEQYLVHDNDEALVTTAEDAFRQLEVIFDADIEQDNKAD